jgi:hypothetical protein
MDRERDDEWMDGWGKRNRKDIRKVCVWVGESSTAADFYRRRGELGQ